MNDASRNFSDILCLRLCCWGSSPAPIVPFGTLEIMAAAGSRWEKFP